MRLSNLNYTVGDYNESLEGTLSTSGPALLAETFAWAVQNEIPFHEVILSLMQNVNAGSNFIVFLLPRSKKWDKCLMASYYDLTNGMALYETLRKRFAYFLPEYYLQGVEKAEEEGRLKEVLPVFAKRLNLFYEAKKHYRHAVFFPFIEFTIICCALAVLAVFIFPHFNKIFENVIYDGDVFLKYNYIFSLYPDILAWIVVFISVIALFHLLGRILSSVRSFILMFLREIFIFIPPFRWYLKNTAFLELSSSMASYLDAGEDILNAAIFSEKSCKHFWLKRKLEKFINKVEKGENWLEAWNSMDLKQNLSECLIRNAASKENIAVGFDTMSEWFFHKQIRMIKNNAIWFILIFTAVNAALVFSIMFYVFWILTQIIYAS